MTNKYKDTISKIKVDEEFKQKMISDLKLEQEKMNKKESIFMKIKGILIGLVSTVAILAGSGVAYAAFGGTINGVPVIEWLGISFSDKYEEYVEFVPEEEKQVVENDRASLTLQYSLSDDGFIVLDFDLKYKDALIKELKDEHNKREEENEKYARENGEFYVREEYEDLDEDFIKPYNISFNDFYDEEYGWHDINSSYSNIIIDGQNFNIRGREAEKIGVIDKTGEFDVTKMWLLTESELDGKEEFTITLKDPVINYGEDKYEQIEGEFNVNLSKEKTLKDTTSFENDNSSFEYKRLSQKITKVTRTPLQDIIKVTTTITGATEENSYNLDNKDYINEMIDYKVYDESGNRLKAFVQDAELVYEYADGSSYTSIPGEYETNKKLDGGKIIVTTFIVVGRDSDVDTYKIKAYTRNDYLNTIMEYGSHKIDVSSKKVTSEIGKEEYKNIDFYKFLDEDEIIPVYESNYDINETDSMVSEIDDENYVDLTKEF